VWSSSDKSYSTFLLQNAEHPKFTAQDRTKGGKHIPVSVPLSYALLDHFRQLSEGLPGISFQQHERRSQAFRRNGHPTRCFSLLIVRAHLRGCVDALANAGINIYALATSDTVDHTVVRMVVSDPTKALMLLGEAGVLALETDVLTIETANQPVILAKIAERLADAKVNIEYTYLAAGREAEKGLIILQPSDVEKARRALEEL
jgi:hypothetical protein